MAVAFFVTELIEFAMLQGAVQPIEIELKRFGELSASLTVSSDSPFRTVTRQASNASNSSA